MNRREFLQKGVVFSALSSLYASTIGRIPLFAAEKKAESRGNYDLVAVRNGEPVELYQRAMAEMGGIGTYVKPGQTVVLKPNASWDTSPERAANTNPDLMAAIVKDCLDAGARRVYAFDHTCDNWERSYTNSGVKEAVENAGGQMLHAHLERYFTEVSIPGAERLKNVKVHEKLLEGDVFINIPVLKHHGSTTVTIGMKNLMGLVWDRGYWHRNDLHQCIADFCLWKKPDLNIVDAYLVMTQNGPKGTSTSDLTRMRSLIVSEDIIAADAASSMLLEHQPGDIGHIRIGAEKGVGNMQLDQLNIRRVAL
ncbi:MAG: DUF362 domain-containing protein [Bacteroidales bacterium]